MESLTESTSSSLFHSSLAMLFYGHGFMDSVSCRILYHGHGLTSIDKHLTLTRSLRCFIFGPLALGFDLFVTPTEILFYTFQIDIHFLDTSTNRVILVSPLVGSTHFCVCSIDTHSMPLPPLLGPSCSLYPMDFHTLIDTIRCYPSALSHRRTRA